MAGPLQQEPVGDMSAGRNTKDSELLIGSNQSPDDLNLEAQRTGGVQKRGGTRAWTQAELITDSVLSGIRFYKQDGRKFLVFTGNDKIMYVEGDYPGSPLVLDSGFVPCQPFGFAQFNDWLYMANFADLVYRWDGDDYRQAGLVKPVIPAGATATKGLGSGLEIGAYVYKITASYGGMGESNISAGTLTVSTSSGDQLVNISTLDSALPQDAVSFHLYRTLVNPPSDEALRRYYFVDTFVDTYQDDTPDLALLSEYALPERGDRELPPNSAYLANHNQRMFYAYCMERDGSETFSSRFYYSDLRQPDRIAGFQDVFKGDGDVITGIVSLRSNLVVFKRNNIYSVLGFNPVDFEIVKTEANVGCIAPRSIAVIDNEIYFLGKDGVYIFNGSGAIKISEDIQPDIDAIEPADKAWMAGGARDGKYYLTVKS